MHEKVQEARLALRPAGVFDKPIFTAEGPEHYEAAFKHNAPFAKPGPYRTELSAEEESKFRQWVKNKKVPFDPAEKVSDYDMRGFWKNHRDEAEKWKTGKHFPDTYKTPYDTTFSAESKYAKPGTPFEWKGNKLIDKRTGQIIYSNKE